MARIPEPKEKLDRLARRGAYSLAMGLGGLFAYMNDKYRWVSVPEHDKLQVLWLEPVRSALGAHFPLLVLALGIGFLLFSTYCLYRYVILNTPGGQSA